jgi:hypothetical protein
MPRLRRLVAALVPLVCGLPLAGALPPAQGAERALPVTVTVHDTRTSSPAVDISEARLQASWYFDSQQIVRVKVPHGFGPGQRLDVFFDLNGDSTPDGHFDLRLKAPRLPGGTSLQKVQEFRLGGGWGLGGTRVMCTGSEGFQPASGQIRRGQRSLVIGLDLWSCLRRPHVGVVAGGSWRAAVRLARGRDADMAPNGRGWSARVAGWAPCDPSDGPC